MKVLAFNSSPRKDQGGTALILNPFLDGARDAGADVELIDVADLTIKPCRGCYTCWLKTPGRCVYKDDMADILPKIASCDALVLGTPLYVDGMTGTMKMMLDRMIPIAEPFIEVVDGRSRHTVRGQRGCGSIVLVSVSGFPELVNFLALVEHVKAICANMRTTFAGALLRPAAALMPKLSQMGVPVEPIYEAAREAGRQLVTDGTIPPQLLEIIGCELIPREQYLAGANAHFKQALDGLKR